MNKFLKELLGKEGFERAKERASSACLYIIPILIVSSLQVLRNSNNISPSDIFVFILILALVYPVCLVVLCLWEIVKNLSGNDDRILVPLFIFLPGVIVVLGYIVFDMISR